MISRFGPATTGAAMSLGGAAVALCAVPLPWVEVRTPGFRDSASGLDAAFDGAWLIAVAVALMVIVGLRASGTAIWPIDSADIGVAVLMAVLVAGAWVDAREVIDVATGGGDLSLRAVVDAHVGFGLYVAAIGAVLALLGSYVARQVDQGGQP